MTDDVLLRPATELVRLLRKRAVSAVELVDLHLERIDARNGELGALVLTRFDEARAEAVSADRALASGAPVGPLHGLPFTTKDAIAVAGMRRTNGFTEIDGEPVRPGGKLALCTLANAVGLPAAAVPVLRSADGLPIGVQLIGGRGRDREVIAAARAIEAAHGGFIAP